MNGVDSLEQLGVAWVTGASVRYVPNADTSGAGVSEQFSYVTRLCSSAVDASSPSFQLVQSDLALNNNVSSLLRQLV